MNKKYILALVVIIIAIVAIGAGILLSGSSSTVNVYIDGENVTTSINSSSDVGEGVAEEIQDYTLQLMDQPNANTDTLKEGIKDICSKHGFTANNINIDSSLGKNSIPVIFENNGQDVLVNKTQNINVGDIVVVNSTEYGLFVGSVDQVNGSQIHVVNDENAGYSEFNGGVYEISAWLDSSDIRGVVVKH